MKKLILGLLLTFTSILGFSSLSLAASGQAYPSDIATVNHAESFVVKDNPLLRLTLKVGGGVHEYGVKGIIKYSQYSKYTHNTKTHRTTAMMNDKYTKTGWVAKKKTASAETPKYWGYKTNNSYWATK